MRKGFPTFERLRQIEEGMKAFFNRAYVVPPNIVVYEWDGVKAFMSLEYRRRRRVQLVPVCYLNYSIYSGDGKGAQGRARFGEAGYGRILRGVQNRGKYSKERKKREKKVSENKNEFAKAMSMMKMEDDYIIRKGLDMEMPDDYPYKAMVQDILRKVQDLGAITEKQKKSVCIALAKFGKDI